MRWLLVLIGLAVLVIGATLVVVSVMTMASAETTLPFVLAGLLLAAGGIGLLVWAAVSPRRN